MKCPRCGKEDITYSHRRTLERIIRYVDPRVFYRCKECWTRFWKFEKPIRFIVGIIIVLAIIIGAFFIPSIWKGKFFQPEDRRSIAESDVNDLIPRSGEQSIVEDTTIIEESSVQPGSDEERIAETDINSDTPVTTEEMLTEQREKPSESDTDDRAEEPSKPPAVESSVSEKSDTPLPRSTSSNELKKLQVKAVNGEFEMTMLTDKPVRKYNSFYMESPPRLVINLKGEWTYSEKNEIKVESGMARRVRIGKHSDYISIVIDLKNQKIPPPVIQKTSEGLILTIKN